MAGDLNEFLRYHFDSSGRYQSEIDRIFNKYKEVDSIREEDLGSVLDISNLHVVKEQDGDFKNFPHFGKSRKDKPTNYDRRDLKLDSNQNVTFDRKFFQEAEFDTLQDISHCVASYLQGEVGEGEPSDAETISSCSTTSSESIYTDCLDESPSSEYEFSPKSNPASPVKDSVQGSNGDSDNWDEIDGDRNSRSTVKQKSRNQVKYQSNKHTSQVDTKNMNQTFTVEQVSNSPHSTKITRKDKTMRRIETDYVPLKRDELQRETFEKNNKMKYADQGASHLQRGKPSDSKTDYVVGNYKHNISLEKEVRANPFHQSEYQRDRIRESRPRQIEGVFDYSNQNDLQINIESLQFPGTPKSVKQSFENHSETPRRSQSLNRVKLKSPTNDLSPSQRKFAMTVAPNTDKFRTPRHHKHSKLIPARHDSPKQLDGKNTAFDKSNSTHVDSGFSTLHEDPSNLENESMEKEVSKLSMKNLKAFNESFTENTSLINVTNWIKSPDRLVNESVEKHEKISDWLEIVNGEKLNNVYCIENQFNIQSPHNLQRFDLETEEIKVQFEDVEHHKIPFSPGKKRSSFVSESRIHVLRSPEEELNRSMDNQKCRRNLHNIRAEIAQVRPVIKRCVRKLNVAKAFEELKHLNAGDLLMVEGHDDTYSSKAETSRNSNKYYTPGKRCINEIDGSPKMDMLSKEKVSHDNFLFPSKCRKLQQNAPTPSKIGYTRLGDAHLGVTNDNRTDLISKQALIRSREEQFDYQHMTAEKTNQGRKKSNGITNLFDGRESQMSDDYERSKTFPRRLQTYTSALKRHGYEKFTEGESHLFPPKEDQSDRYTYPSRSLSADISYDERIRNNPLATDICETLYRQDTENSLTDRYGMDRYQSNGKPFRKSLVQNKTVNNQESSDEEEDSIQQCLSEIPQDYFSKGEIHQILLSPKQKHDVYRHRDNKNDLAAKFVKTKQDVKDRFLQMREAEGHNCKGKHQVEIQRNNNQDQMATNDFGRKTHICNTGLDTMLRRDMSQNRIHHLQAEHARSYNPSDDQSSENFSPPSQKRVNRLNTFSPSTSLAQLQLNTPTSGRKIEQKRSVNTQSLSAVRRSAPRVNETERNSSLISEVTKCSLIREKGNNNNNCSESNITKVSLKSLNKLDLNLLQHQIMTNYRPENRVQDFRRNKQQFQEDTMNYREFDEISNEDQALGGEFISLDKLATHSKQIKITQGQLRHPIYITEVRKNPQYSDHDSSENEDTNTIYTDELSNGDMQPYKQYYHKIVDKDQEHGSEKENLEKIYSEQNLDVAFSKSQQPRMKKTLFATKVPLSPCNVQKVSSKQLLPQSRARSANSKSVMANQSPLIRNKSELSMIKPEVVGHSKSIALRNIDGRHFLQSTPIKKANGLQFNDTMSTIMGSDEQARADEEDIILIPDL